MHITVKTPSHEDTSLSSSDHRHNRTEPKLVDINARTGISMIRWRHLGPDRSDPRERRDRRRQCVVRLVSAPLAASLPVQPRLPCPTACPRGQRLPGCPLWAWRVRSPVLLTAKGRFHHRRTSPHWATVRRWTRLRYPSLSSGNLFSRTKSWSLNLE